MKPTMNAPNIRWSVLAGEMEGEHRGESEEGKEAAVYTTSKPFVTIEFSMERANWVKP